MESADSLNPFARKIWDILSTEFPQWTAYLGTCGENDLEVAVPAPSGSKAGYLVVFTSGGKDLWVRFSPPRMCYPVADESEMLTVIRQLQTGSAAFVVVMQGDEWVETTLIDSRDKPRLEANQTAYVVSWSGQQDHTFQSGPLA